jgi:hypothetical protein
MDSDQIFDDSFERTWNEFDEAFRKALLESIREMGSLHRLTGDDEKINTEYGRRFYRALEETLAGGQFIERWKKGLNHPLPHDMDELEHVFRTHSVYPLHAFYLLLVFVHEYPLRAFFSGRDLRLPFNTLTLKFQQSLGDALPTSVDYELDMIRLDRCPGLGYASDADVKYALAAPGSTLPLHPQHHRKDLIWVWHFVTEPSMGQLHGE